MFTRQTQQINENLWQGGLSAAQAHAISNLLGQCRQTLDHRGPVQIDYTTPDMKLIMPESAQIQFPEIQLQPPESLPPRPENPEFPDLPPEERPPYQPNPLPPPQFPQYPGPGGGSNNPGTQVGVIVIDGQDGTDGLDGLDGDTVEEGDYIKITDKGNNKKEIALDHDDSSGTYCVFENDKVKGIKYEATNSAQDPCVGSEDTPEWTLSLNDSDPSKTTWDLASPDMQCVVDYIKDLLTGEGDKYRVDVVTGISFDGSSLSYQTRKCTVLDKGDETDTPIDTTTC